jgi:hypothetical protein
MEPPFWKHEFYNSSRTQEAKVVKQLMELFTQAIPIQSCLEQSSQKLDTVFRLYFLAGSSN